MGIIKEGGIDMSKEQEVWTPPEIEFISLGMLVSAIKIAKTTGEWSLVDGLLEGLDKVEWYSGEVAIRMPENVIVTPAKVGGEWNSFQIRV